MLGQGWKTVPLDWETMDMDNHVASSEGKPHAPAELSDAVGRLVAAYEPERIYLFGSVARGDHGEHSDFDLLIVVSDDAPPERRESRLAYERLWGTGIAVDALVCSRSWFEARRHLRASLPGTVLREGRLLYAA